MDSELKEMTSSEEKELKRVFDDLCNFLPKSKIRAQLAPLVERLDRIRMHKKNPDALKIYRKTPEGTDDYQSPPLSEEEIEVEFNALKDKIEELNAQLDAFKADLSCKIRPADLNECMKNLGKTSTRKEVEEMIWEVDENLDNLIDYKEFKLMFQRNITDDTGLEPFQLFNLVQFLMYDKDGSGKVAVDETMHMLYTRYGKDRLQKKMTQLFGEDMKTEDGDGELSFNEYLKAVSVRIPKKPTVSAPKGRRGRKGK